MITRILFAAALALAFTACAQPRDDWGGVAQGVGGILGR